MTGQEYESPRFWKVGGYAFNTVFLNATLNPQSGESSEQISVSILTKRSIVYVGIHCVITVVIKLSTWVLVFLPMPVITIFWCSGKMPLYLVCYDIANNQKRYRVDKLLKGYGVRAQKSLFECHLSPMECKTLLKELKPHIRIQTDSLRIYSLCPKDLRRVEVDGHGTVTEDWSYLSL